MHNSLSFDKTYICNPNLYQDIGCWPLLVKILSWSFAVDTCPASWVFSSSNSFACSEILYKWNHTLCISFKIRLLSLIMLLLRFIHVVFISNLFLFIVEFFSNGWIHGIFFVHSPTDEWKWKWKSLSCVQLFVTPMDYTVHGIFQARMLEWVAFPFSRAWAISSFGLLWIQLQCT